MPTTRQYHLELGAALLLYAVLLVGTSAVERATAPSGIAQLALALVPMIGAVAMAWAVMRGIWRLDEMQRRIQLDAIAIAFLGTALITFGWGFGEDAGLPQLRAFSVWPIMAALWCLGLVIAHRRYR